MAFTFIDEAKEEDGRLKQPTAVIGPAGPLDFLGELGIELTPDFQSRVDKAAAIREQNKELVAAGINEVTAAIQSIPPVGFGATPDRKVDQFSARMSGQNIAALLKQATGSPGVTQEDRVAMLTPLMTQFNKLIDLRMKLNEPSEIEQEAMSLALSEYGEQMNEDQLATLADSLEIFDPVKRARLISGDFTVLDPNVEIADELANLETVTDIVSEGFPVSELPPTMQPGGTGVAEFRDAEIARNQAERHAKHMADLDKAAPKINGILPSQMFTRLDDASDDILAALPDPEDSGGPPRPTTTVRNQFWNEQTEMMESRGFAELPIYTDEEIESARRQAASAEGVTEWTNRLRPRWFSPTLAKEHALAEKLKFQPKKEGSDIQGGE